jgi:predicted pyridoxine 5'-phosphate oxidase superfamily flavin-nucleotide-binding protein
MTNALATPLVLLMSSDADGVACATGSPSFVPSAYAKPAGLWPTGQAVAQPTAGAARRRGHGIEVRPRRTAIV